MMISIVADCRLHSRRSLVMGWAMNLAERGSPRRGQNDQAQQPSRACGAPDLGHNQRP